MRLLRRYSTFFADVAKLASGRGVAMAIKLALTPVIARLFDPTEFGVVAFFVSLVTISGALSTLRYERAIVLPDDSETASRLAWVTMVLLGSTCLLVAVVAVVVFLLGQEAGPFARLGPWVLALPIALALVGAVKVAEGLLVRAGTFGVMARADVAQSALTNLSRVGFGASAGSTVWGLMASYLLGLIGRVGLLLAAARGTMPDGPRPDRLALVATAREYRDFPLNNAPTGFLRDFSNNMPVFALSLIYSPAVAGFYAMAARLVWMPINTAAMSMRRVVTQRLAKYRNAGLGLLQPGLIATGALAAAGIVPFTLLWLFGETAIPWVLGEKWTTAGQYVVLLTPWFFFGWFSRPAGALLVVLRRQEIGLRIQIVFTLARLAVFAHAYFSGASALDTLKLFVLVSIAGSLTIVTAGLWLARAYDRGAREAA